VAVEYRIISIGTLANHLLWQEAAPVRTQHATTTLIDDNGRRILVDPSLPVQVLEARFFERTGQKLSSVTDVFCTTLRPDARRALPALQHARWWCGETELEWYSGELLAMQESVERLGSADAQGVAEDLVVTKRFAPAPEKFTEQVSLYPLFGATVGCTGLLLTPATTTIVIAGPAAVTREHVEKGMVWSHCADKDQAMESLTDLLELADVIVPGFDNIILSPRRWM
jgi:glyoxylase-like metal-dependent hydrolase (beta-lactamase superfamily II)